MPATPPPPADQIPRPGTLILKVHRYRRSFPSLIIGVGGVWRRLSDAAVFSSSKRAGRAFWISCCDTVVYSHPVHLRVAAVGLGLLNEVAQLTQSLGGGGLLQGVQRRRDLFLWKERQCE